VIGIDQVPSQKDHLDVFISLDLDVFCTDVAYRQEKISEIMGCSEGLTVLVNNAAVQLLGSFENISISDWQRSLNVNLTAPMLISQALISVLERNKGSIINIGSIHSQLTKPNFVSYATSKSALTGLTKAMAVDLRERVRVNSISPAAIETEMLLEGFEGDKNAIDELRKLHPVGRIGTPEDIAELVYFLVNQNGGFIHGANLRIDGGISSLLCDL
jgi:NAD(P)-dependent dehydrogenase (short-subunit alcohol dehydrogenase family)